MLGLLTTAFCTGSPDFAEQYAKQKGRPFARRLQDDEPLHLDFASRGNRTFAVEDFYDSFVDLLVLGNARCVAYGIGGFGAYANQLSYDPSCSFQHSRDKQEIIPCQWCGDGEW